MNRGEYLTKVMEEKGFNVMSLSKASGVAYTTIRSMIERDLTNASIDNVLKICRVLEIKAESLNNPSSDTIENDNDTDTIAAHHELEEDVRALARDIQNLDSGDKNLLTAMIKTMRERGKEVKDEK